LRESSGPAAAVIPAQMVYIKIVVIKKFVVWIWINGYKSYYNVKYCNDLFIYSLIEQGILCLLKGKHGKIILCSFYHK